MNIPSYYEFYNPVKIISGFKALENLPYELDNLNAKKPLIITDQGIKKAGLVKHVVNAFGESNITIGAIYDNVPQDSSKDIVNEIVKIFKDHQCDSLIAVGGGSVMDTAKGVNIVITEGSDDLMKFQGAEMLKKPMKPLIAIPTTAGTGSEVTYVAVIKDHERKIKMAFTSYHLFPRVAILDPRMTLTLPSHITAATAMDALTHAIEAYICVQKNPISDIYAWKAVQLITENLIPVLTKDKKSKERRLALSNAACMAGAAFSNSMVGVVHTLGHATGAVAGLPHGYAMSLFLPYGLRFNFDKIKDQLAELYLPLVGSEKYATTPGNERAQKTIEFIDDLRDQLYEICKIPRTLVEAGIPKEKIEEIAKTGISDGSIVFNPKEVDYNDLIAILNLAYDEK